MSTIDGLLADGMGIILSQTAKFSEHALHAEPAQ